MSVVHRTLIVFLLLLVQVLTPYSIKRMNGGCPCGCAAFVCYCCGGVERSDDVDAFSTCRCKPEKESFELLPFLPLPTFDGFFIPTGAGAVVFSIPGVPLPGYYEPPVRPPPFS
jgi:hypothetical protein